MGAPSQSLSAWLRAARAPFLNLLRNLTPQIFLASLAWLFGAKLKFTEVDVTNWMPTGGFFLFLAMFLYAFYANASLFFEEAFADLNRWLKEQDQAIKQAAEDQGLKPRLFRAVWRERKLEAAIAAIVLLALEYLFAGVVASSIAATINFMKLAHS